MALYIDPAKIGARLPDDAFTTEELVEFSRSASSYVDDALPNYWPFPEYSATVSTPQTIQDCALNYGVWLALGELGEDNELVEDSAPMRRRDMCDQVLSDLARGVRQIAQVLVSAEALTFGSDADYPDWALLENTEVSILEESAEILGYRLEEDFRVFFSKAHRAWICERLNAEIVDGDEISYSMSYLRLREKLSTPTRRGGDLIRG